MKALQAFAVSVRCLCIGLALFGGLPALAGVACPAVPAPVRDLSSASIYGGGDLQSGVDSSQSRQRELLVKPVNEFMQTIAVLADQYVDRGDADAARCALDALRAWAKGEAFLGQLANEAANKEVIWNVAGLGLAYLRLKPAAGAAERADIEGWLATLAGRVVKRYGGAARHDNVHAWVALGAAACALATGDNELWRAAVRMHEATLEGIDQRGVLRAEIDRGRRALAYHNFALVPLIVTDVLRSRGERPTSTSGKAALERLATFTLGAARDTSVLANLTGQAQDSPEKRYLLAWSYIAAQRFENLRAEVPGKAPPFERWLGGNVGYFVR